MSLKMIDLDQRNVLGNGQPLGERDADEQRAEQARAAREGDAIDLVGCNAGSFEGSIDHRDDVLLVSSRGQLGDHAAVFHMNVLIGNHIREQRGAAQYGRRCVVTGRFDA